MTVHTKTTTKPQGELLWFRNSLVKINLSFTEGVDQVSVIENWLPFADSPPLHVHHRQDEIFHVLEGTMRFRVDERDVIVHAGSSILAPKGIPHTFRVESATGVRCLVTTVGPDFETMVREMSTSAPSPTLPAHSDPTPEMIRALVEACTRNNIAILGAPLA